MLEPECQGGWTECQTCHTENGRKPVKQFDHNTTHFPLTGKHMDLDCAKCHKTVLANTGV